MLIEDSEDDSLLLVRELMKGGYEVSYERIDRAERVEAAFKYETWDAVFCDHSMPGFSGVEALALYKKSAKDIPFIFVSGTIGEDAAVAAMKAGAHDYVMKSNIKRLLPALERELREAEVRKQQRQAEENMREQQAHFRQLFENATVGIVMLDLENHVLDVNRAFEEMFQFSKDDCRSTSLNDLIVPESHLEEALEMTRAAAGGVRLQQETVRKRKDGNPLDVVVTGFPILLNGKVIGVYGMYLDVTQRKEFEARLIRAQRLESIGILAGGIAHDFNNILGIILGHAALIDARRRPIHPDAMAKGIDGISRAVKRGAGVVRQLLTFARKTEITFGAVSLNEIAKEMANLLQETFPANIDIALHLAPSVPVVHGDGTLLHQVLLNLCVNARDAMPQGGRLDIFTSLEEGRTPPPGWSRVASNAFVRLAVTDTGIGMDAATRARIFEPFFTTKELGQGTGLGLATVYGIVQKHQGFIDVASEPGKGSAFEVFFPVEVRPKLDAMDGVPSHEEGGEGDHG